MIVVIEVEKSANENTVNLLRRFTKKVNGSRILKTVRGQKHASRPVSKLRRKQRVLKTLRTIKEVEKLRKLGKLPEKK